MARWRDSSPPRIEAPAWYRQFEPAAWDAPDALELAMMAGCSKRSPWPDAPGSAWPGWPLHLHEEHARRRWQEAQHTYRLAHPLLAEQEIGEIMHRGAVPEEYDHPDDAA